VNMRELPFVLVFFAVESVGPEVGRGSSIARANAYVVGVDEFLELPKIVNHGLRPGRTVIEHSHHCWIVL
jgi:hypothetical protein